MKRKAVVLAVWLLVMTPNDGFGSLLNLGPEEIVQAGGLDITVPGYSVPSYMDWNNDGKMDLIVGQGSGSYAAKVRVYLNEGTPSNPQFSSYFFAQSDGADLTCPGSGCLGLFPRVVYWDADARKDLLVGRADGTVQIFLNTGTDSAPTFDAGTLLEVRAVSIDVGSRACPTVVDWDNDGLKDLAVGALDGRIHLFVNEGTDTAPDFLIETFAEEDGLPLVVPSSRSSPVILELDGDGKKDLLTGNTYGQLLLYSNVGTDAAPSFSGHEYVESAGIDIDLVGSARSRPFVCDWMGDGCLDVLIGAGDGKVHLYQRVPEPTTLSLLSLASLALLRNRRSAKAERRA